TRLPPYFAADRGPVSQFSSRGDRAKPHRAARPGVERPQKEPDGQAWLVRAEYRPEIRRSAPALTRQFQRDLLVQFVSQRHIRAAVGSTGLNGQRGQLGLDGFDADVDVLLLDLAFDHAHIIG